MHHLAVIMDGNGRYAAERGESRSRGHVAGAEAFVRLVRDFVTFPFSVLTVYAFSTENGKRSVEEVGALFDTIGTYLTDRIYPIARENGVSVRFIGNPSVLPEKIRAIVESAPRFSEGKTVQIALGYGGYDEVCRAVTKMINSGVIDVSTLKDHLDTAGYPDPDAVVRYGGQHRISNFMPLQIAYSELFFLDKYWPDYERSDIEGILNDFTIIKRSFGE